MKITIIIISECGFLFISYHFPKISMNITMKITINPKVSNAFQRVNLHFPMAFPMIFPLSQHFSYDLSIFPWLFPRFLRRSWITSICRGTRCATLWKLPWRAAWAPGNGCSPRRGGTTSRRRGASDGWRETLPWRSMESGGKPWENHGKMVIIDDYR